MRDLKALGPIPEYYGCNCDAQGNSNCLRHNEDHHYHEIFRLKAEIEYIKSEYKHSDEILLGVISDHDFSNIEGHDRIGLAKKIVLRVRSLRRETISQAARIRRLIEVKGILLQEMGSKGTIEHILDRLKSAHMTIGRLKHELKELKKHDS